MVDSQQAHPGPNSAPTASISVQQIFLNIRHKFLMGANMNVSTQVHAFAVCDRGILCTKQTVGNTRQGGSVLFDREFREIELRERERERKRETVGNRDRESEFDREFRERERERERETKTKTKKQKNKKTKNAKKTSCSFSKN